MEDKELDQLTRDPRYAGKLKKTSKKDKEALKDLFGDLKEEETYKDKRGRPWPKHPIKYAKQLIKEEEEEKTKESSEEDEESTTESDSDSSSSAGEPIEENLADLQDADWYNLVQNSEVVENTTRRLAVLHFDWDNSNAETIFLALESFLPPGTCLEKVSIYPSEYGMKRMAEEETHGPRGVWKDEEDDGEKEGIEDADEAQEEVGSNNEGDADEKKAWRGTSILNRRRLRRYQLQRLKYFYAIAEFDNKETAGAVYEACDGVEYASTGVRFDLRFVSDEETFSVPSEWAHLVSECSEVNRAKFKPRAFENSALHSTRITLGWDRTPAARTEWLREQFEADVNPQKLLTEGKAQLSEYLALSSSGQSTAAPSDVDEPPPAPTVPRIRRHRPTRVPPDQLRAALLSAIGQDGHQSQNHQSQSSEAETTEDEEVFDLNKPQQSSSDEEEYDLTAETENRKNKTGKLFGRGGRKVVSKRKAFSDDDGCGSGGNNDSDSSLDFEDMEGRVSDDSGDEIGGGRSYRKRRRGRGPIDDEEAGEDVENDAASKKEAKRKKRHAQRKKMLLRRKKHDSNQEKLKDLWTGPHETDPRFDRFLSDPAFGVSQLHRNYKEAGEFLNFMRRRRAPLKKTE